MKNNPLFRPAAACALWLLLTPAVAQQHRLGVKISNPCATARGAQVVELDAARVEAALQPAPGRVAAVRDAGGRRLDCQRTYDGKLLFFAEPLAAKASRTYYLTAEAPAERADTAACGRFFPERADDMAWENDLTAFRAYGPALQARGERAYGYDAFAKRVPYPVLKKWYDGELRGGISYHRDHGEGMDCYNVGPTLGCGTSALLDRADSLHYPWCFARYEILDNGPLRFTVRLTYRPFAIDGQSGVTETRLISLDKGSRLNKTLITYEGLSQATPVVTGFVIHSENPAGFTHSREGGFVACEDLTNNPAAGNGRMYVGAVFPERPTRTGLRLFCHTERRTVRGALGHVTAQSLYRPGHPYLYYWGSGWSKSGIADMAAWQTYLEDFRRAAAHPLKVRYFKPKD